MGRREENVMCGTLMGWLVTECLQSVSAGLLRNDICPRSDEENCEDGRRVDLNSVINSLEVISNSPHAKRIAFLIRGCFPGERRREVKRIKERRREENVNEEE